jgi:hypothetical protein
MAVALADYRSEVGQPVRGRGYACRDSGFVTGRSRWAGVGCIIGGEEICFFVRDHEHLESILGQL